MSDEINYLTGFSLKDIITQGNSGIICLNKALQTVVKSPHKQENEDNIAIEKRIYERFSEHGGHEGLLYYYRPYKLRIRLDFAYNSNLRSFLKKPGKDIDIELRLRQAKQIRDALRFIQATNVVHRDVTYGNILLNRKFNTKLSDFRGSSLNKSPLLVAVTSSHQCPRPAVSIQGDIFALGSTLYKIMTGDVPYYELPEEEVEAQYSKGEFPETNFLGPIKDIITLCQHSQYSSFDTIITDIKGMCAPNSY